MKGLIIQNCKTEGIGLYEQYLLDRKIDFHIVHPYENPEFPPISQYDFFIIGGTPISVYDIERHEFLRKEYSYIKEAMNKDLPCLGICFGGQLLAKVSGAEVKRNSVMEIGGYEVKLTESGKEDMLFRNFPPVFPVFHWHGDTFTIPKGAELLVSGIDCRNQSFRYKRGVALQFHLEITSAEASSWADEYEDELKKVNKTKEQVVGECMRREEEMHRLCYLLMDNFLRL